MAYTFAFCVMAAVSIPSLVAAEPSFDQMYAQPEGYFIRTGYSTMNGAEARLSRSQLKEMQSSLDFIHGLAAKDASFNGSAAYGRLAEAMSILIKKFIKPISVSDWQAMLREMSSIIGKERPLNDWDTVVDHMLQVAVLHLKDPHTDYMGPEISAKFWDSISRGTLSGIGVEASADASGVRLDFVYPGYGADKAGLKDGDIVAAIDGKRVAGVPIDKVHLEGEAGTSMSLVVLREGRELDPIEVTRTQIELPGILKKMVGPNIGYIYFTLFQTDLDEKIISAIRQLRDSGAEALIIDVRGNPGGNNNTVSAVAAEFLSDGDTIAEFRHQEVLDFKYVAQGDGAFFGMPVAVLIDERSASASEILAGVLKYRGYPIVGARSYGKGTKQVVYEQSQGRSFKITEDLVYIPIPCPGSTGKGAPSCMWNVNARRNPKDGSKIPGTGGIIPDYIVDVPLELRSQIMKQRLFELLDCPLGTRIADPVVEKAVEVLTQRMRGGSTPKGPGVTPGKRRRRPV